MGINARSLTFYLGCIQSRRFPFSLLPRVDSVQLPSIPYAYPCFVKGGQRQIPKSRKGPRKMILGSSMP